MNLNASNALKAVNAMIDCDDFIRKLQKLPKDPANQELMNDIGVMLYEMNDYENARSYLARARELSPANHDILYNYAHALYACLDWQQSAELFKEYGAIHGAEKSVIEKIADAAYQLGDYQAAAKYQVILSRMEIEQ
jgi:Flp pilus assembly protein TadD